MLDKIIELIEKEPHLIQNDYINLDEECCSVGVLFKELGYDHKKIKQYEISDEGLSFKPIIEKFGGNDKFYNELVLINDKIDEKEEIINWLKSQKAIDLYNRSSK